MEHMGKVIVICIIGIVVWVFFYYSNNYVMVSEYRYVNTKIPKSFIGFKILQISDLHGDLSRWKKRRIIKLLDKQKPNIVVFTGDAVDHVHRKMYHKSVGIAKEIVKKYPVYYVTGNHEYMHSECLSIISEYEKIGVTVLRDQRVVIHRAGEKISIFGIEDPYALYKELPPKYLTPTEEFRKHFHEIVVPSDDFCVLLSHRPEFFEDYVQAEVNLVFAGHAHGGQWWVPFVGGFIAPDQGMFPSYVRGKYQKNDTTMFVSRGLGNSVVPIRIFNRPELIVVTLQEEEE